MTTTTRGNAPTHNLYVVNGEGDNARWTRIGAAFGQKDEQGFTLLLDALPIGRGGSGNLDRLLSGVSA